MRPQGADRRANTEDHSHMAEWTEEITHIAGTDLAKIINEIHGDAQAARQY